MRIGLVIYGTLDTVSGGYLYDRAIVEHLRTHGDEVEVVSLPWRNYAAHLGDNLRGQLLSRLRGATYDLLLQDELNHPSLFWLNRRLRGRYPIVSIVHHLRASEQRPAWQNALYRQVERAYLQTPDAFIFNSETTRGVVEGLVGDDRPHLVAYPAGDRVKTGLSRQDVTQRAHQPGPLRVLFVGNLIERKGLHTLLNALQHLPTDSVHLTVVGGRDVEPAYTRRIEAQAARLGEGVTFTGKLLDRPLIEQYERAHVLAVPSSYEGFGIVYLEGMGAGLPAIASTAGAAHEIVTDGVTGYLIAPGDAATLAEHLRTLHQDRGLLAEMGKRALERYYRHPTWQQMADSVRGFLRKLV